MPQIFLDLLKGVPLPTLTQFVIDLSDLIKPKSILLMGGIAVVVLAAIVPFNHKFNRRQD